MKSFINREINIDLFNELLEDTLDVQRVHVDVDHFMNIKFSKFTLPSFYVTMCIKLSGLGEEQFIE